jgi:minichromosome maintenance protein 10
MQLDALAALQSSRKEKEIALGPRPGQKIRSGVVAPHKDKKALPPNPDPDELHDDLDGLCNKMPAEPPGQDGDSSMIDLDDL